MVIVLGLFSRGYRCWWEWEVRSRFTDQRRMLSTMSDMAERLNAALEGRYAIERELGEGGMATVYLADDLSTSAGSR